MIVLDPGEVCPFGAFCEYADTYIDGKCGGLNPDRNNIFICELWAENYEKEEIVNA